MKILSLSEYAFLENALGRSPNELEQYIISAEWSEHCSYKSSKKFLKLLPTKGSNVIVGPGFDAGVIDVGDGYVITVHIESHNHPSAIEPHGGAATGVGGVLRDILSLGTRPIAILNALRFGSISNNYPGMANNQWLFKNVVKGIADYGNCMGIPTVGGEVEFDNSFDGYCLVDVASIGHGKLSNIIKNKANVGDIIVLAGNSTGKDGIHGASFASKNLEEENRSAVQIPDPFLEKILLEATIEAIENNCLNAIKDLGGGGLSCCLSETADSLGKGFEIDISKIHLKQNNLSIADIMLSESQERMLFVTSKINKNKLIKILNKHGVNYSIIGTVNNDQNLTIKLKDKLIAKMPAMVIAHAPLLNREYKKPDYLSKIAKEFKEPKMTKSIKYYIQEMISNPTIASKNWIYQQFDYEVGLRTVLKPGNSDSSLLKLDNNKFISFKLDGNSKQCYLDPYNGTMGILAEAACNTICVGANPIGILDHLQFGNPENPEIFWTFIESIKAIIDFCKFMDIPVIGGKVSLYNETTRGPIKPSPVIGMLGLIEDPKLIKSCRYFESEEIFIIGNTFNDLGGSEYFDFCFGITGVNVPVLDLGLFKKIIRSVKQLISKNLISGIHDCSKGGIIVSLIEMAIQSNLGFELDIDKIPNECNRVDYILFSESTNRFIFSTKKVEQVRELLKSKKIPFAKIGRVTPEKKCILKFKNKKIADLNLNDLSIKYNNLIADLIESKNSIIK